MTSNRLTPHMLLSALLVGSVLLLPTAAATAQERPLSLRNSFPIGSNGLCEAQILSPADGDGPFDRRYAVICRDASAPVGTLWVVRDPARAVPASRFLPADADCLPQGTGTTGSIGALSDISAHNCRKSGAVERRAFAGRNGNRVFAATGLAVYDDALRLGLAALAADRTVPGEVRIPLTQAADPQAFARAQAEAITPDAALAEAYRRNNSGNYADAAEFFSASAEALDERGVTEALLNQALQQSNLGNYIEAARLFAAAQANAGGDMMLARLSRNFEALDALNRESAEEALEILARPLPGAEGSLDTLARLEIDTAVAGRLSAEQGSLLAREHNVLTALERAQLLDGQASYIRATALRLAGRGEGGLAALQQARDDLAAVRDGRVTSILWLRAQILAELADVAERGGDVSRAEGLHADAIRLLEENYPGSPALMSARALLAGLYARTGRAEEAIAAYRDMVNRADSKPATTLRRLMAPYFALLAQRGDAASAADMFDAAQLLLRPGLAQTQSVLARELSGGSDEAAQLFRQAVNVGRAVERARIELAQTEQRASAQPDLAPVLPEMQAELDALRARQLALQEQLAAYPRYRAISDDRLTLPALQQTLGAGEAYYKMVALDNAAYAIFITPHGAQGFAIDGAPGDLARQVDSLRATIAVEEGGQTVTYPFDIAGARDLYKRLFQLVNDRMGNVRHLVFEPDGAMLRLPVNLLVTDDTSVAAYAERTASDGSDAYDFRGTAWLGRAMDVTTSVAPASFRDVRAAPPSRAKGAYIGFGQNTPVGAVLPATGVRAGAAMDARCMWSASAWNNPIKADELQLAGALFRRAGGQAEILTGQAFTDTALKNAPEMNDYRVMHFATHGLVTAPRPQCPPRPALLTSFGGEGSDGLLSFAEIYDLRIDADLVVLSACNTASQSSLSASREAGIFSTGDFALDGLVRAFVGAGGRTLVASHWPVPDDYDATQRLIGGLFEGEQGQSIAGALRQSQLALMDDAKTSHPFYWSAFAIVGDGAIPVKR